MRFSSFIAITAAGLAIAAPITPVSPSNVDKQLTVEPAELYKRQVPSVPDTSALTGLTKGLPVGKRQVPSVPDTSAITGLTKGLPIGKRQLGGLGSLVPGSDDASAEDDEPVEPKEPKEPKLPSSVSDNDEDDEDTDSDDADATDSATSKIPIGGLPVGKRDLPIVGGLTKTLPVGKRQLSGLSGLLGMDKADPVPSETPAANSTVAAAEESATPVPTPSPSATPAPAPAGGLGGILKSRQLSGLLGADKAADDADTAVKSKTQSNDADDGTNTPETSFSADEPASDDEEDDDETTEEAAPVEDEAEATPAPTEAVPAVPTTPAAPAGGLGGLGGILGM
jgi:hypothetical protein